MSSPNPSFSLGMSAGPSGFFVPPGLRLPARLPADEGRPSVVSVAPVMVPFIRDPMRGTSLAEDAVCALSGALLSVGLSFNDGGVLMSTGPLFWFAPGCGDIRRGSICDSFSGCESFAGWGEFGERVGAYAGIPPGETELVCCSCGIDR